MKTTVKTKNILQKQTKGDRNVKHHHLVTKINITIQWKAVKSTHKGII